MCGRYSLTVTPDELRRLLGFLGPSPNLPPRYNIAPTQDVAAVRRAGEGRTLVLLRWGLIPPWSKGPSVGAPLINARGESVAEKPSFREAFRKRRCLIPADGFYEWKAGDKDKTPYRIGLAGGTPEAMPLFAFAGLWERWEKAPDGRPAESGAPVESCAIVTTEANPLLRPIHERMPVILAPEDYAAWLDPATPVPAAQALLKPYPAEAMAVYPVSTRVNAVRHDDAACLAPADGPTQKPAVQPATPRQLGLF